MNKMQVAPTDPCIFVTCHIQLEGEIPKDTLFHRIKFVNHEHLGSKGLCMAKGMNLRQASNQWKTVIVIEGATESRMIIRKEVRHCHHLSWKEGSRASDIMEPKRRGIRSYLWKHG